MRSDPVGQAEDTLRGKTGIGVFVAHIVVKACIVRADANAEVDRPLVGDALIVERVEHAAPLGQLTVVRERQPPAGQDAVNIVVAVADFELKTPIPIERMTDRAERAPAVLELYLAISPQRQFRVVDMDPARFKAYIPAVPLRGRSRTRQAKAQCGPKQNCP